jgi:hypothetical protein
MRCRGKTVPGVLATLSRSGSSGSFAVESSEATSRNMSLKRARPGAWTGWHGPACPERRACPKRNVTKEHICASS